MENFISVLPFGGILMMSLLRLGISVFRLRPLKVADLPAALWGKVASFLEAEYRLVSILVLSGSGFLLFRSLYRQSLPWHLPVFTGVIVTLSSILLMLIIRSWILPRLSETSLSGICLRILTEGEGLSSPLPLVACLSGVLFLLSGSVFTLNGWSLMFLATGYTLGMATTTAFIFFTDPSIFHSSSSATPFITSHRSDALLVSVAAALFITSTLPDARQVSYLPVLLALTGLLCSVAFKALSLRYPAFQLDELNSGLSLFLISIILIHNILPDQLLFDQQEISREMIWQAIGAGLVLGWLSSKTGAICAGASRLSKRFVATLSRRFKFLHTLIHILLGSLGTGLLLVGSLGLGGWVFASTGLYGIFIAGVALFAFANTSLANVK
jgi:hypothetical protein